MVLALVALVLGVPHGAVDHLTLARPLRPRTRALGAAAYVGTAAIAAALVLLAPAPAFVVVLALSVWHFGSGDVEAGRELRGAQEQPRAVRGAHLLALGAVPVLLPLTSPAALATVAALEPRLVPVLGTWTTELVRAAVLVLSATVLAALIAMRRRAEAAELASLVAVALAAPPLVAFAVYFAAWHALRHTLRLAVVDGRVDRGRLRVVVRDGAPALLVAAVLVLAALVVGGTSVAPAALWTVLAAVWGLTVPHMLLVSAFDRRRRAGTDRAARS